MFNEALKTVKTFKPSFLLVILLSFSFLIRFEEIKLFEEPLSFWTIVAIPVAVFFAHAMTIGWGMFVIWLKFLLPPEDLGDCAFWLACSMLVFCLTITLSFFASNTEGINAQLFIKPSFIYTCTLYAATLVAFDIAGSAQKH